ncbi:MAG: FtsX-like permease family protein [Pseudomonadota bacterium]
MSLILRLAWRSIWRNRRRTAITILSIGFGLALAIFFISVAEGVYVRLIDQVTRTTSGHVTLEHPAYQEAPAVDLYVENTRPLSAVIRSWPQVDMVKPLVLGQGMAKSGAGSLGAAIMGVDPAVERMTSPLPGNIREGEYLSPGDQALVVIGRGMAGHLNLAVGKKLVLATNDAHGNLVEELCRVKGVFATGSEELDSYFIQAPLGFASRLFGLPRDAATRLGVVLKRAGDQDEILRKARDLVKGRDIRALPWQEVLPEVASYIRVDKGSNWIFQGILIFIVLFTIFNTLLMSVLERKSEFAVLLAIGTRPRQIRAQVFLESLFLGFLGCAAGLLLGGGLSLLVNEVGIDLASLLGEGVTISGFAMDTRLYAEFTLAGLFWPTGVVFGATLLLSLIPMRRAVRVTMADAMR